VVDYQHGGYFPFEQITGTHLPVSVAKPEKNDNLLHLNLINGLMRIFLAFLCLVFSSQLFSQPLPKKEYAAQNSAGADMKTDGILDEAAWQNASWENNFIQSRPYEGRAPRFQTEFAILYDHKNMYVAFKAYDNQPDSISLRMTRRDQPEGDVVSITFDTYHDKRTGFSFSVSAAGVRSDMIFSDDGAIQDPTWDPIWWVKTSVNEEGWVAEMCIPLTQLRFNVEGEQLWGMQAGRYIFRFDESSQWQPIRREQAGYISNFGTLGGLENLDPKKTLNLTPYTVARLEMFEKEPGNPFRSSGRIKGMEAGLDAKIGLTSYLTMDLTINPDFGQVEADPSRVNLSAFETFFEEKRPFFVEGKNIMKYQLQFGDSEWTTEGLFYSRRIGRQPQIPAATGHSDYAEVPEFTKILGAAKVTGKSGNGWSVGILESVTRKEHAQISNYNGRKQLAMEPLTNYFVSRIQKDFNKGNTYMGGIITAVNRNLDEPQLESLHKSAYSAGFDWVHKWHEKAWNSEGGIYMSHVSGSREAISRTQLSWVHNFARPDAGYLEYDPERTSLTGYGGKFSISKIGGKWKFGSQFSIKSPGLELNDVGFAQQIDQIQQVVWTYYEIYNPFSVFRSLSFNLSEFAMWDFGGNKNMMGYNLVGNSQFINYWRMSVTFGILGEQQSNSSLRGGPALRGPGSRNIDLSVLTNPQKKMTFRLSSYFSGSRERDYSLNRNVSLNIGYRPVNTLRFDVTPGIYLSDSQLQYVSQHPHSAGRRYIFARIDQNTVNMSFRVSYSINPDLTVQYWGQPFIASGAYSNFKHITNSKAEQTTDRYHVYSTEQISFNEDWNMYAVDENLDGHADYSFGKPDFNVKTFLSNLVMRWEYLPGSAVYLVWSQNRDAYQNEGNFDIGNNLDALFSTSGTNIFLMKFSYRFGR